MNHDRNKIKLFRKMALKVGVILGSVRPGRMGDRVGKMITNALVAKGHTPTTFDPAVSNLGLLEKPLHFHGPNETKPPILVDLHTQLKDQDAFVIVTPEYNFS